MKTCLSMLAPFIASLLLLTACNTDELCYDHPHVGDFAVKYDWSKCPDANPGSMAAYFYPLEGEGGHVACNFTGREGGKAHLSCGSYQAIGLNSDHEDWARMRNEHDIELFEIYTADVVALQAFGIDVRALPPSRDDAGLRMAMAPSGPLYSHRKDDIAVTESNAMQTVTFYPEEATCHYTVTITDVTNIKYLRNRQIDGSISGMAEGFAHGRQAPTDVPVSMPFVLTPDNASSSMHAQFLTLGCCAEASAPNIVTIYVIFDDASAQYYTFDVTAQVRNAPDPHHVDIVISGLSLPKPIVNGGGFRPSVTDWINQTEEIVM